MSNKEDLIKSVMDIVVDCCKTEVFGVTPITADDVVGQSKKESVCMTRCIFVAQMLCLGYSRSTVAEILHRSERSIGDILKKAYEYKKTSYAFRLADAEATIRMKEVISKM